MVSKKQYNHKVVEAKWSKKWLKDKIYQPDIARPKKKFYNLWMFPYPSAEGLHAGHAFASTGSDVFGRFMRMRGNDVFQPIGYDSFGIHSENFAIKTKKDPHELISKTTKNYARQMMSLGHGYDWSRTVTTSDPDYYKWTQWLFIQMFKAGLAYRKEAEVNFCPSCKTVLADEQVLTPRAAEKLPKGFKSYDDIPDGVMVCERCGTIVNRKKLEQWFFRITKYADRLLNNLDKINWSEKIKITQSNWIGKKEGINISYKVVDTDLSIVCWTSRPDTNFGASFIVISPENPIIDKIITAENKKAVDEYIKASFKRSYEVKNETRKKTGVFTGSFAINPLNNQKMPIWVSDFVLMDFGTGAVVGVPGHDQRDFEFAKEFGLPIKRVVVGPDKDKSQITKIEQVYEGEGEVVNSGFLNGLTGKAKEKIMSHLEAKGWGKRETMYHLRDWLISRQRYWGPPIPMIYCEKDGWVPVPESDLPVKLPKIKDFLPKGTGRGPLADHPEFYNVACPECGSTARRETDVSDTFLDSSWYFLAYPNLGTKEWKEGPSASSGQAFFDKKIMKAWLPVDLYFGGSEHAVLHLMYARFVPQVLYDLGYLPFDEAFPRFFAHGLMIKDGAKMSKSRGNVVNPDSYIAKYGADTLRLYLMFMGPMDGYPDFRDTGIEGMRRFVERVWSLFVDHKDVILENEEDTYEVLVKMHQTIKKVTEDVEEFKYNTAISAIMELVNALRAKTTNHKLQTTSKIRCAEWDEALITLAKLIAPFAPFMAEEIWAEILEQKGSIHTSFWPKYQEELIREKQATIVVQIDGKARATLLVPSNKTGNKNELITLAKKNEAVAKHLSGKKLLKEVFVRGKVLNFVTK